MIKHKKITIIGTSHISPESVKLVKKTIKEEKPEIVAIELDTKRYQHLVSKYDASKRPSIKLIRQIGFTGYVISVLGGWLQKKLSQMTGSSPGSEMMAAVKAGAKEKSVIAFMDRDIAITLKRLSKAITWKEKFRFLWDIVSSPFKRNKLKFDLNEVPTEELIERLIGEMKKSYPTVYDVLIHERDVHMAKVLNKLAETNKHIIAVVGAGHEKGILKSLQKLERS